MKKFLVSVAVAAIALSGTAYARDYSLGANTNLNPNPAYMRPAPAPAPTPSRSAAPMPAPSAPPRNVDLRPLPPRPMIERPAPAAAPPPPPSRGAVACFSVCPQRGFTGAGLPYFNPHSLRNTLAQLGERLCATPEAFKSWSQNLGHEGVLTTLTSYGAVEPARQAEIIRAMWQAPVPASDLASRIAAVLQQAGIVRSETAG
jgi:hypothetical protein